MTDLFLIAASTGLIELVECRTLWGEPEQVHVQNMEHLHAHDRYQNVTEHKTSGHSTRNKMYRYAQHRKWVGDQEEVY